MLKFYPDRRFPALIRFTFDLLALAWVLFWALAGWLAYQTVMQLEAIADGLRDTGKTFDEWIAAFRDGVPKGIPYVSNWLVSQSNALARHTGDPLIQMSGQVRQDIFDFAVILGVLVAVPPIAYILLTYGVWRWRDAREMGAALQFVRIALVTGRIDEARALLAYRAIASLTFTQLMRTSRDPVGDLAHRRYDALAGAMLSRAGLEPWRLARPPAPDRLLEGPKEPATTP